jgi:hypothetical protein
VKEGQVPARRFVHCTVCFRGLFAPYKLNSQRTKAECSAKCIARVSFRLNQVFHADGSP